MELGKIGAWVSTNALNKKQLAELARGAEDLGYDTLVSRVTTYNHSMGSFLLANSSTLQVASGIANICARDPFTAMSGHNSLNTLYEIASAWGLASHIFRLQVARACVRQTGRNHARLSGSNGGGGS